MGQNLSLIVFGIMILAGLVFYIVTKKQGEAGGKSMNSANQPRKEETKELQGVKRKDKVVEQRDMSGFIKFDKIANDMIYQNNGERYSMVIQCKGINYNLMSEIEQMAVEEGFIMFLNTLKFPIQLYVQTKSIDLSENIKQYKDRVNEFAMKQSEVVNRYNELEDDVDATQEEIDEAKREKIKYTNITEYVSDITRYVEKMALNRYMLQRNFYIILSYNKAELATTEKFSKQEYEDLCYRELYTRAQGIVSSLLPCSVSCNILTSNQLAQLVYVSLNKDDASVMNIKEALESGVFRLYTSSEDVMKKKREMLDEELNKRSMERVEQAVKEAIDKGILVTEDVRDENIEKEIDRRALRLIDKSTVNNETKQVLKNTIKTKRKERLEALKEKQANEQVNSQQDTESISTTSEAQGETKDATGLHENLTENVEQIDEQLNKEQNDGLIVEEQKKGEAGNEE